MDNQEARKNYWMFGNSFLDLKFLKILIKFFQKTWRLLYVENL